MGPTDLTEGTVSGLSEVPTWMDNVYSHGLIVSSNLTPIGALLDYSRPGLKQSSEVLGVSFVPESGSDTDDANGELTVGGVDTSKYSGAISYFPKSMTAPYS